MKAVVQRVSRGCVTVEGDTVGAIEHGLVVLLGVGHEDGEAEVSQLAEKLTQLRIFDDDDGKMNRSLIDVGGSMLIVSQFTLLADCRKGRRPSYTKAASPELAERLYDAFVRAVQSLNVPVATGRFRAHMEVSLVNDGPVTIIVEV